MSSEILPSPTYPIAISHVAKQYYLYNIHHITHLRHTHNISGVLIGTLPQAPQQNVFLGLPLELMPEEARLLVEKRVAYIVDDVAAHKNGLKGLRKEDRRRWRGILEEQGREVGRQAMKVAQSRTDAAIQKMPEELREKAMRRLEKEGRLRRGESYESRNAISTPPPTGSDINDDEEDTLFPAYSQASPSTSQLLTPIRPISASTHSTATPSPPRSPNPTTSTPSIPSFAITPTLSHPPLSPPAAPPSPIFTKHTQTLPKVPSSYPLYTHLHSLSYFLSPGLRFGCQYMVYPGDPLRFHSHFLAVGYGWEEEIELLSLVGGGRLGTGVKKGFLVGGKVEKGEVVVDGGEKDVEAVGEGMEQGKSEGAGEGREEVRCFCIEWGGM